MMTACLITWLLLVSTFVQALEGTKDSSIRNHVVLENGNGGCIGLKGGEVKRGTELVLAECDTNRNDIVWNIDSTGLIQSNINRSYCWTIETNAPDLLQLQECKKISKKHSFSDI